jgi:hypothetical protein
MQRSTAFEVLMFGQTQPASTATADWRGLAIGVEERGGAYFYRVRMVHDDPVNMTLIVQTEDEREAVVAWRYWAATLGLPRMIEHEPDAFHPLEWRLGGLIVRGRAARRRGSPLFSRRPGRLAKRRIVQTRPSSVHRNEREIIARD